jgi:drug efflux transport system permease protein
VVWERVRVIIRKEVRQTFREPRMRSMLFIPPLVQLLVFGYAVNLDVENARLAWMDQDRSQESRELLAAFEGSNRFELVATPANDKEVQNLLDSGDADCVVRILPGFARDIERGRKTSVQVLVDGTNSNTASIVASYASSVIGAYANKVMTDQNRDKLVGRTAQGPVHAGIPQIRLQSRVWFNADLRSRNYFVPGVVVNIITLVTLMLTAMAIVREKEIGTMEQLMVTPIRPIELMLGKTLPFAVVGLIDTILVVVVSLFLFHIPFRGSAVLLLVCAILFLMTSLGAGLFISTISQTQQQAMMSTFLMFQPFFMLSGFAFPIRNMPVAVQWLTYLDPVRYFVEIVRGIFLRGSGVSVLWPQMAALAIFGTAILSLSAMRFRKRLD